MNNQRLVALRSERGQATLLMTGVVVLGLLASVAIALVGNAMVHRARARTAADSVALAGAIDQSAASESVQFYADQGVTVEFQGGRALAGSGPAQAAAWASTQTGEVDTAPALRAIVARAEQLRGQPFLTIRWSRFWFELAGDEAHVMQPLAAEFQLCIAAQTGVSGTATRFEAC